MFNVFAVPSSKLTLVTNMAIQNKTLAHVFPGISYRTNVDVWHHLFTTRKSICLARYLFSASTIPLCDPHTAPLPLQNGLRSPVFSHHAPQGDGMGNTHSQGVRNRNTPREPKDLTYHYHHSLTLPPSKCWIPLFRVPLWQSFLGADTGRQQPLRLKLTPNRAHPRLYPNWANRWRGKRRR